MNPKVIAILFTTAMALIDAFVFPLLKSMHQGKTEWFNLRLWRQGKMNIRSDDYLCLPTLIILSCTQIFKRYGAQYYVGLV